MRKHKYKLWDKKNKVWDNSGRIYLADDGELFEMFEAGSYNPYMHRENVTERYKIVFYTGRKNKDGIEIYEDDIVMDREGRYGVVYWNPEESRFLVDFQSDMEIEEISFYHTVCGNSWESVELLK